MFYMCVVCEYVYVDLNMCILALRTSPQTATTVAEVALDSFGPLLTHFWAIFAGKRQNGFRSVTQTQNLKTSNGNIWDMKLFKSKVKVKITCEIFCDMML